MSFGGVIILVKLIENEKLFVELSFETCCGLVLSFIVNIEIRSYP